MLEAGGFCVNWRAEEIKELAGYTVEWAEPGLFYLSKRNVLYRTADLTQPFVKIGEVEASVVKGAASRLRLLQRLFRFMFTNVVPLEDGRVFVTFDKTAGIFEEGNYRALDGLVRPCRVLRSACAADDSGDLYFGEYLANTDRGEMRVYRLPKGGSRIEEAYVFPRGSIRHIHGIYFDEIKRELLCLTGDDEDECRILRTSDGFAHVDVVGEGDESWRAVSILFGQDSYFYGTDAEYRANLVYQMDRNTLERRELGEVNGTVFYSKRVGESLFFATTAEDAPSQTENVAAIWHVMPGGSTERVVSFPKDRWHTALFMFGLIHFPYMNAFDDRLYFSIVGVEGDGATYKLVRT